MTEHRSHIVGLGISLTCLVLFWVFGTGVVAGGFLLGVGMFAAFLLVALKNPKVMRWCDQHATATEIGTTLGTFFLFSVFGGGTVTAGVASAVMCLMVSATLGCSKLGFLQRWISDTVDVVELGCESTQKHMGESVWSDFKFRFKAKEPRTEKRDFVAEALARAVQEEVVTPDAEGWTTDPVTGVKRKPFYQR